MVLTGGPGGIALRGPFLLSVQEIGYLAEVCAAEQAKRNQ
jgi:hypothetical protein